MSYNIEFTKEVAKVLKKWKKSRPQLFKKYSELLEELMLHPKIGKGHPEPLIGGNSVRWSRHISGHNRIIYDIREEEVTVLVIQVEEHYNDK